MGQQIAQEQGPSTARREACDPAVPRKTAFAAMALGSLGVVYGDIGTSPLMPCAIA
jgi:K+ transporter